MFQQVKLFKPGALTPSSMHSEVPGALTPSGWESVVENKPDSFAMDTPCATGTSIPATPLWTDAQLAKVQWRIALQEEQLAQLQHNHKLQELQQQQHDQQEQQAKVEQEQQLQQQLLQ